MKRVCLCLPEYPEKIEAARQHFEEAGLGEVEFFWGINAEVAGLATSHPYEIDHPGTGFKMGTKATGIWLGHVMLWASVIRESCEHIMVLETDAQFLPGWEDKLNEALRIVPSNFDFLHIGHCCVEGHPRTHVGGDVWESKRPLCTHAYIVRRAVIPFLLKTVRKCYAPIDCQLVLEVFPHLNCYAVIPRLVDQFGTVLSP